MTQTNTVSMYFPAGLLYNTKTRRWHPFFFRASPRPSDNPKDTTMRFRSAAHHTDGFACLGQAKQCIRHQVTWKDTCRVWEWDGEEIPATTADFAVNAFLAVTTQIGGDKDG